MTVKFFCDECEREIPAEDIFSTHPDSGEHICVKCMDTYIKRACKEIGSKPSWSFSREETVFTYRHLYEIMEKLLSEDVEG